MGVNYSFIFCIDYSLFIFQIYSFFKLSHKSGYVALHGRAVADDVDDILIDLFRRTHTPNKVQMIEFVEYTLTCKNCKGEVKIDGKGFGDKSRRRTHL